MSQSTINHDIAIHNSREEMRRGVRLFRHDRGWTQAVAAGWWGCSERQWRRYESGHSTPPFSLLKRIARGAKRGAFPRR